MAVSNFEFKEVLYMFLFVSKLLGLQVNDITSVRGRYWIAHDIKENRHRLSLTRRWFTGMPDCPVCVSDCSVCMSDSSSCLAKVVLNIKERAITQLF